VADGGKQAASAGLATTADLDITVTVERSAWPGVQDGAARSVVVQRLQSGNASVVQRLSLSGLMFRCGQRDIADGSMEG
jgi:hypothetical protein